MFERLIWLVPLAVAALGAWRPRAGLLVLAAALPFFGASDGGPYLAALEVSAIAAILTAWRGGRAHPSPVAPAAGAFVAVSLLSLIPLTYAPPSWRPETLLALLQALPEAESWSALYSWRAAADLIIGYALLQAVRRAFAEHSPRPLALAVLTGLVATLLLGLAAHGGLLSLDGYRPDLTVHSSVDYRLRSVFFTSTRFAEYLVIATPFGLAGLIRAGGSVKRWVLPLAGLALLGLALTLQRGAWGAAAIQLAFLAAASVWRRRMGGAVLLRQGLAALATVTLIGSILLVSGVSFAPLRDRISGFGYALENRLPLWAAGLEMFRERPLLGQGLGSYAPAYDRLQASGAAEAVSFRASGHHLYLQTLAERGALGLLAFVLLGIAALLCLRRPRPGSEALAWGLAASLLGIATYGLVQNLFQQRNLGWLIWILLGSVALVSRARGSVAVRRAAWCLVAAGLLVVPFRLAAGAVVYAGTRELGLHEVERGGESSHRWTSDVAIMRLRRGGDTLVLTLANGHPLGPRRPVRVAVEIDGRGLAQLEIAGGWQEHRIDLRGVPPAEWVVLELHVEPTFRPYTEPQDNEVLAQSIDHRRLGVAMREPAWEP